ncbi:transglutaminaseTgpA domain-containing protein [Bacillus sp. CGMCC 1.16541]|uniref:transglutaminase TgpA family protein n=1 Tax=Bacillus sp. CGMCC 1.16541 TaxID=2185143 RepID=UPI000D72C253|nr:transglutaminaseTgpA domain-containing protein [Bacillus sp. CGMCC 1.16541]
MKQYSLHVNKWVSVLLYVGSFLLLWEWLKPLRVLTDTGQIQYFVIFLGLSFLLLMFSVPFYIQLPVKITFILYTIHSLYKEGSFFSSGWMGDFLSLIQQDLQRFFTFQIYDFSNEFRSLLFFILLWLMAYLVYFWIFYQKRIFVFIALTVIYVAIVDTFSPYDATYAIMRVVTIGFLLLGFLHAERLKSKGFNLMNVSSKNRFFVFFLLFTMGSMTFAYFAPKAAPQWPDPVPFLKGYATGEEGEGNIASTVQKVGYGVDDSQLGGPFVGDDTVVFRAQAYEDHYWKIESKDIYTGKGWEATENERNVPLSGNESRLSSYGEGVKSRELKATVSLERPSMHLMYPSQLLTIEPFELASIRFNPITEKLYPYAGERFTEIDGYEVTYRYPEFQVEVLQSSNNPDALENNPEFQKRYTQLPDELPGRVKELAREITEGKTNRYDQVKAVEQYFRLNSFVYDTKDVAVPEEGQDYVDQFLFETKRGYCDNFSTSMIVLLRALDIPARWVKGYTDGEEIQSGAGTRMFEVTQNNAHSWVEVYFPEIGWIPFEPTKSFTSPYEFTYDLSLGENSTPEVIEEERPITPKEPSQEKPKQESETRENTAADIEWSWKKTIAIISGLLMIIFILYVTRNKWFLPLLIHYYKAERKERTFEKAYFLLLNQLAKQGIKRKDNQTLRAYAKQVDARFETNDMTRLTVSYEKVLYRKEESIAEWNQSAKLWENLIKKAGS